MIQSYEQWLQMKKENPGHYARDIAQKMQISEAELNHIRTGHDVQRLKNQVRSLLNALESVGEIKSLCRNAYAVHEHIGCLENQHLEGHAGLILNPRGLDLRLFLSQWASVFSLCEAGPRGERHSIQFFDHAGDSVLKLFATENTDLKAWMHIIETFTDNDNPALTIEAAETVPLPHIATATEATKVEAEWRAMTDVHQFFTLLNRHQLTRQQAFRLVSDDLACVVDNAALMQILNQAKADQNEIMVFVGNRGCVQIFTGQIHKTDPMDNWINIFNPEFTLHLMTDAIAESWVTRKPTQDGYVTSLELFASDGTQIAQLYGQRTEGQPESVQWRKQIEMLLDKGLAA